MSSTQTSVEPVRRTVVVNRSVEDAFRVFTEEIGKWWALDVSPMKSPLPHQGLEKVAEEASHE